MREAYILEKSDIKGRTEAFELERENMKKEREIINKERRVQRMKKKGL